MSSDMSSDMSFASTSCDMSSDMSSAICHPDRHAEFFFTDEVKSIFHISVIRVRVDLMIKLVEETQHV